MGLVLGFFVFGFLVEVVISMGAEVVVVVVVVVVVEVVMGFSVVCLPLSPKRPILLRC